MLSKTAMALVPAASLVGAAALAPTTSLAQLGEKKISCPKYHDYPISLSSGPLSVRALCVRIGVGRPARIASFDRILRLSPAPMHSRADRKERSA